MKIHGVDIEQAMIIDWDPLPWSMHGNSPNQSVSFDANNHQGKHCLILLDHEEIVEIVEIRL